MSLINTIALGNTSKLVIPCAGKMFKSSIPNNDKALCFVLNKGYFESTSLQNMLSIIEDSQEFNDIILVGKIDKVRLKANHNIVYRQRIFFKSLGAILNLCKLLGLKFELASDFHISINNIMNCITELVYLERYAKRFDESIDDWLTHCCIIELHYLLKSKNIYSGLEKDVDFYLKGRENYLERAPFLVSSYNIDTKSSGLFLDYNQDDSRLFREVVTGKDLLGVGYTDRNVEKDVKVGRFK
jgi:hypothetical protein